MTALVRAVRTLVLVCSSFAAAAHAETTDADNPRADSPAASRAAAPFGRDDLMLFEVRADGLRLSDSFEGYASRGGVYLPLGALARLLDLVVVVVPPEGRAEGWVMERGHTVSLDLNSGRASSRGREFTVSATDAALFDEDIYVRADLVERLLPVKVDADLSGLSLRLTPTEALPFQNKLERERRRGDLQDQDSAPEPVLKALAPYALFTRPAAELVLDLAHGNRAPEEAWRYDLRLAGDLAYAGFQMNAGSDDQGELAYVRVLFERSDADGRAAGRPWGLTRVALGDAYTPALSLGARSVGGRGGYFTTAPLEEADVFDGVDLRGELPPGYEVELYVNDVLRASQAAAVAGRYEFLDVPLAFGGNVLRLVFYGPRGERREEVRRINYGRGRVPAGRLQASFGAAQQNMPVVELDVGSAPSDPGHGRWRVAGGVDYGLTEAVTLSAGFAQYTPAPDDTRRLLVAGARASVAGFAMQADVAGDSAGGRALALGAAGRPMGLSMIARHAEYRGGFLDETHPRGALAGAPPLRRSTELRLDALARLQLADLSVPIAAEARRDEATDGALLLQGGVRLSAAIAGWYFTSSWAFLHEAGPAPGPDRVSGAFDGAELAAAGWRLRGGVTYDLAPEARLSTAFLTADHDAGDLGATRLGLARTFGTDPQTTLQLAQTWRLSAMDVSVSAAYALEDGGFRVGMQLALGAYADPWSRRYLPARPGVATGGDLALLAFVDHNRDGTRQPDEPGLSDLPVEGGPRSAVTDAEGRATVTGLGAGPRARLRIPPDSLGDPYLTAPASVIEFAPRAGRTVRVDYPVAALGEVEVQVRLQRADAPLRGLAAVHVDLVAPDGSVAAAGATEHDGTLVLDRLPPGEFVVRLDPVQAERLNLRLVAPAVVRVPPQGGFVGRVAVAVTFEPSRSDAPSPGPSRSGHAP